MKTIKLLSVFAFSLMLLTAVTNSSSLYLVSNGDPGSTSSKGNSENELNYDECQCTCEACKNCSHWNADGETWINENYYRSMSSRDFGEFKKFISERTFESTKLDMAKSVIDMNYFTTEQVKDMLGWFTFESNKLDLAKYTFKNTVDRNNYYKLYNIFVFESNVVDLDNYVKNFR